MGINPVVIFLHRERDNMKLVTSSQRLLNELVNQEFSEAQGITDESRFFEVFSSQQIVKSFDLSDEEIENCVLGAGNDGGCDAVFVMLNGTIITEDVLEDLANSKNSTIDLVIVQAKRETSFSEDAIMKWKTTAQNLMEIGIDDSVYTARYNEDVLNAFRVFRELYVKLMRSISKLNVIFAYASFAEEVHPNVRFQANELQETIKWLFPGPQILVSVEFWGATRLLVEAQKQPESRFNLPLAEAPINIGSHHDFVALVNLAKYFAFITDERGDLKKYIFESNVRDYQGHNAVNQDIQDTLENPGSEDFWWLNNGITLLTEEASLVTNKELILKEPAIVNGLQTSNEIYQYYKRNPGALASENRNVLIRIIVPESEQIRDKIILATNNQTNIPKSSLRANDPIHWQIELFFKGRGLYYDRRKNYYKNQGKKSSEIISVSFLAQCMISLLLQKPNFARARPSTLLSNDEYYNKLYSSSTDLDVYYNVASIGKKVERFVKALEYSQAEKNDILFYVMYYAVARYANKLVLTPSIMKGIGADCLTEESMLESALLVYEHYCALGGNGKTAKGTELVEAIKTQLKPAESIEGVDSVES